MRKMESVLGFSISYIIYAILGIVLSGFLMLIFSILKNSEILDAGHYLLALVAMFLASFSISFLKGMKSITRRMLKGLFASIIMFCIIFAVAVFTPNMDFTLLMPIFAIIFLSGISGGILSVFTKVPR